VGQESQRRSNVSLRTRRHDAVLGAIIPIELADNEVTRSLDEEAKRHRLFELVTAIIAASARGSATAVILEDVHWADTSSIQLAAHVADSPGASRVLIYLTARRDDSQELEVADERYRSITLSELPGAAAVQLATTVLGVTSLPPEIAAAILARAQGNPLFLEEIARELRKSGALQRLLEMPTHRLKDAVSELYLPDRVQTLIMSRIDALPSVTKEILRAAAVLGEQFDWPSVRAILEAEWAADLDTRVRELVDKAMLEPTDDASIYRFRHGLIREVAYESLAFSRRRRLHQRAGSFFEVSHFSHLLPVYETLAYHYLRGGNKPRALLYSIRAGDKARAAFANEEGIDHYTRALALARDVSPREARDAGVDASVGLYTAVSETCWSLWRPFRTPCIITAAPWMNWWAGGCGRQLSSVVLLPPHCQRRRPPSSSHEKANRRRVQKDRHSPRKDQRLREREVLVLERVIGASSWFAGGKDAGLPGNGGLSLSGRRLRVGAVLVPAGASQCAEWPRQRRPGARVQRPGSDRP
jgi:predicted ATPase